MPVEACSAPACQYKTGDYPIANALEALRLHCRAAHPENFVQQQMDGGGAVGDMIDAQMREKLRGAGCDQEHCGQQGQGGNNVEERIQPLSQAHLRQRGQCRNKLPGL